MFGTVYVISSNPWSVFSTHVFKNEQEPVNNLFTLYLLSFGLLNEYAHVLLAPIPSFHKDLCKENGSNAWLHSEQLRRSRRLSGPENRSIFEG